MNRPLCIIQARLHSARLPNKMLLELGGETLIVRAHRLACEAFGQADVVVAIPASDGDGPLGDELRRISASVFAWDGAESDVLGRFHACAHHYRWHPQTVIHRWTPDDPFKMVVAVRAVVNGTRLPVEMGGEAFTLQMLDHAYARVGMMQLKTEQARLREHITYALFSTWPPAPPEGLWTIDTPEQYQEALATIGA